MDDVLQKILGLAWRTVPALEANEAIARARRATAAAQLAAEAGELDGIKDSDNQELVDEAEGDGDAPMARAYELLLSPDATFASFARDQVPRLVYHLESLGAHLPDGGGVVICLFESDKLHFLQASELIRAICDELKLSPAQLVQRYGTHELRTAVQPGHPPAPPPAPSEPRPPLALPGPPKGDGNV